MPLKKADNLTISTTTLVYVYVCAYLCQNFGRIDWLKCCIKLNSTRIKLDVIYTVVDLKWSIN